MSDSPEEPVLSLLLSSSLLKHKRIRKNLPKIEVSSVLSAPVSFPDYLRLRFLVREVDGMDKLVTPRRMRNAFESPEGAERWRASFEEFLLDNLTEIENLMEDRPDLFAGPPPVEDCSKVGTRVKTKSKKKIVK